MTDHDNLRRRVVRIAVDGEPRSYVSGQQRVTVVPLSIHRRKNRTLLSPPPDSASVLGTGGFDGAMIKMLGKAFHWQRLLDQGRYMTASELAHALKLEPGWVAEVLRLTLLAPDIIEAIVEGRQPRPLTLQTLRGRHDLLPRDWVEQRQALGFTAG